MVKLKSTDEDFCDEQLYEKEVRMFVCKQSSNQLCEDKVYLLTCCQTQADKSGISHYYPNIHSTQASLRSVNLNHVALNQAIQTHLFIQNQVINHPG